MGVLAVSVDLDEIRCYHDIHGLPAPPAYAAQVIYGRALERVGEVFEELGIKATYFAVGRDLGECSAAGPVLRDLVSAGNEVGNHTMDHPYDLTLMSAQDQQMQISECARVLEATVGTTPVGFRAPGYNVHLGLLDEVEDQGYRYDSSVFPCPVYTLAKTAVIAAKKVVGVESRSVVGDPRVLLAPNVPYRLGRDGVWTKGRGLLELPITVVTPARIPFIGTSLTMAGKTVAGVLARRAAKLGFVNLELHGIDFVDADGDCVGHLKKHQPDLKIPLPKKLATLKHVVRTMLDKGAQPMTLAEAAAKVMI